MPAQEWRLRRQRELTGPLPAYLQPVHTRGRLRFDPSLQTAGELMRSHPTADLPGTGALPFVVASNHPKGGQHAA